MSFALRVALIAVPVLAAIAHAQIQIDDRPKVVEKKELTKEELKKEQADLLLRHARTLYGIAVIRNRHDKLIDATATLEKAIGLDPDSLEIRRALVPLYATLGREEQAMTYCREILDRDPHDAEIAYQFAKLLKGDGRPAEAIPILQKAVESKTAQERPERLLFMLSDLYDLQEKKSDFAAGATTQEAIIRTIIEKREQLLYGNGFPREDLEASLARSFERLGRARIQTKEFDKALLAFRGARETLLKSSDPQARHQAVRLNWNLCELAAAQERWAEAMEALDAYLQHSPAQVEPYEKKVELLRKLGRERDIVPALRRFAAQDEYHLGLQLLLAREMAKEQRLRREAETMYHTLLKKNIKPEVYLGLFRLYQSTDAMNKVLDLIDESAKVLQAEEEPKKTDVREVAAERMRVMIGVLRTEPELVGALLPAALTEIVREQKREIESWRLLAALAARARKLPEAERFFRQCMVSSLTQQNEQRVYTGLIQVLLLQKKYADVVTICQSALNGPRRAHNSNAVIFEANLATALTELGKFDEALDHADKAIKLTSEDSKVSQRNHKSEILARAERYNDAIRECTETMKDFPQLPRVRQTRYTLSNVYSLKGEHEKSEEQLRLILEDDPDAPLANNNLGYQMADRNINLDEAERMIRRAIEVDRSIRKEAGEDGDNAAYLDSLGWVLFRKGQLDDARQWLEKAAALFDGADDPTVWDHLGDVYAKLRMPAKAKEAWQASAKLYDAGTRRKNDSRRAELDKKLRTVE
jgi:tetratricopeptide (TPR) repeat protein